MKRTGATILSLALAMILVSSLSSGTAYSKGKKDPQVVILDCGPDPFDPGSRPLVVTELQSSTADDFGITLPASMVFPTTCAEGIAIMLDNKFKMADVEAGFHTAFFTLISRYTFVKK